MYFFNLNLVAFSKKGFLLLGHPFPAPLAREEQYFLATLLSLSVGSVKIESFTIPCPYIWVEMKQKYKKKKKN